MTDLLKDLEAVAGLSASGTKGPWIVGDEDFVDRTGALDRVFINKRNNGVIAAVYTNCLVHKDDQCRTNAALIAAAVNFIRTHHAEIAEAVRAMHRVKAMRDEWARDDREHLNTWRQHLPASVICMVEKLDAAIDAQHNSAREG